MSSNRGLRPLDPIFDPGKRLGAISVGNSPGAVTGGGHPVFSWPGIVNFLDTSPPWPVTTTESLANLILVQANGSPAALDIDVLVNGSVVDSVAATATVTQTLGITVPVVVGDYIQLELTDDGAGTASNLGVVLTP